MSEHINKQMPLPDKLRQPIECSLSLARIIRDEYRRQRRQRRKDGGSDDPDDDEALDIVNPHCIFVISKKGTLGFVVDNECASSFFFSVMFYLFCVCVLSGLVENI
jgi:hypothetical protein